MVLKDTLTLIVSVVVASVGFDTLLKAIIEHKRSVAAKRLELFLEMRKRLRDDEEFSNICNLLEEEGWEEERQGEVATKLRNIPPVQKDRFLGFFEGLAIMRNSGLINDQVAAYMFGYYAIKCKKSESFWEGLDPEDPFWALFFSFAEDMQQARSEFKFDKTKFHVG